MDDQLMKTIAQIAEEIGVTKQAVHKKMKQEPLSTRLEGFTTTKGNTVYVDDNGIKLIKSAFNTTKSSISSTSTKVVGVDDLSIEIIKDLRSQMANVMGQNKDLLEQLKIEREHSREQADKLSELASQLAELNRNNQILLGSEQSKTNQAIMASCENEAHSLQKENEGFFKRVFSRKR